jgi:hypothetical protein
MMSSRADRAREKVDSAFRGNGADRDPFAWAIEFELSEKEVEKIADPQWAYPNLLVQGHTHVICAAPNHGKTTIMMHIAGELSEDGYEVLYINADTSGSDAKVMHKFAGEKGFRLLLPDMKQGKSIKDVLAGLHGMADGSDDLSSYVIIVDTMKKLADLMNKNQQKDLFALFRKLNGRNLTLALNSHTNKHNGADGMPVYEGTNEMRSEPDELIYFVAVENPDGGLTVSTIPDKKRAAYVPLTFQIDANRNVTLENQYIDTVTLNAQRKRFEEDENYIGEICEVLGSGPKNQSQVVEALRRKMNPKTVRRVLKTYGSPRSYKQCWNSEKGMGRHIWRYWLIDETKG